MPQLMPNALGIAGLLGQQQQQPPMMQPQGGPPPGPQPQQGPQGGPMPSSPTAGLGSVEDRVAAYRGNPGPLQQRYAMSQDLLDLLALQKIKSEKENAAKQMQLQMAQQQAMNGEANMTVAQQREQQVHDLTKQELLQQRGQTGQMQQAQQQAQVQRALSGGIAQAPGANIAAQPQHMARGGIVGFAGDDPRVNSLVPNPESPMQDPEVQAAARRLAKAHAALSNTGYSGMRPSPSFSPEQTEYDDAKAAYDEAVKTARARQMIPMGGTGNMLGAQAPQASRDAIASLFQKPEAQAQMRARAIENYNRENPNTGGIIQAPTPPESPAAPPAPPAPTAPPAQQPAVPPPAPPAQQPAAPTAPKPPTPPAPAAGGIPSVLPQPAPSEQISYEDKILRGVSAEHLKALNDPAQRGIVLADLVAGPLAQVESANNPKAINPNSGAVGLAQVKPATAMNPGYGAPTIWEVAAKYGLNIPEKDRTPAKAEELLLNAEYNKQFAVGYLDKLIALKGNPRDALTAYHEGPNATPHTSTTPTAPATPSSGITAGMSQNPAVEAILKNAPDAFNQAAKSAAIDPTDVAAKERAAYLKDLTDNDEIARRKAYVAQLQQQYDRDYSPENRKMGILAAYLQGFGNADRKHAFAGASRSLNQYTEAQAQQRREDLANIDKAGQGIAALTRENKVGAYGYGKALREQATQQQIHGLTATSTMANAAMNAEARSEIALERINAAKDMQQVKLAMQEHITQLEEQGKNERAALEANLAQSKASDAEKGKVLSAFASIQKNSEMASKNIGTELEQVIAAKNKYLDDNRYLSKKPTTDADRKDYDSRVKDYEIQIQGIREKYKTASQKYDQELAALTSHVRGVLGGGTAPTPTASGINFDALSPEAQAAINKNLPQ